MSIHALKRLKQRAPKDNPAMVLAAIQARYFDGTLQTFSKTVTGQTVGFFRTPSGVAVFPVIEVSGGVRTVLGEGMDFETPTGREVLVALDGGIVAAPVAVEAVVPMADGIYFRLDEDTYHAIPRLSMSGIQKMLVSPADFWAASWMNLRREPDKSDTPARILGRAYHIARFQPELFDGLYCRNIEKDELGPKALTTGDEITAALDDMGLPKTVKGEKVLDKAIRLIDAGYEGKVWHYEQAMFETQVRGDRTAISGRVYDQLLADVSSLRNNPEVAEYLSGGQAEVSVLWTCPRTGVQMKCRFDYLRPTGFTDFKTFDNPMGKEMRSHLNGQFQFNRYYIQAFGYWDVIDMIQRDLISTIAPGATDEERMLVEAIRANPLRPRIHYVWQQKGGVPNLMLTRVMTHGEGNDANPNEAGLTDHEKDELRERRTGATALHHKAALEISRAKHVFKIYQEVYPDPGQEWYPIKPSFDIDDLSFNSHWLEAIWGSE